MRGRRGAVGDGKGWRGRGALLRPRGLVLTKGKEEKIPRRGVRKKKGAVQEGGELVSLQNHFCSTALTSRCTFLADAQDPAGTNPSEPPQNTTLSPCVWRDEGLCSASECLSRCR